MQRISLLFLALFLSAGGVQAEEKFQRKSGLWELKRTSTVTSGQTRAYQMCIEHASDNALTPLAEGSPGETCEVSNLQREPDNKLSVDATCKIPQTPVVAATHAIISGKFDSSYKVESKTTFAPALRGHPEGSAMLEAKWIGPCKPDQHAGDVIDPRGAKFNVADQAAHAEKVALPGKAQKSKRGRYAPTTEPTAPGSPTPAVPPPGTQTK